MLWEKPTANALWEQVREQLKPDGKKSQISNQSGLKNFSV